MHPAGSCCGEWRAGYVGLRHICRIAVLLLTHAGRTPLVVWLVTNDPPDYPDKFVARLVTDLPSPYLLVADSLAEIHAVLPPNLARTDRQPVDPPEVIEIWFAVT
jgi:hypothetical protein